MSRILYMLSSAYDIPHTEAFGKLVYTNTAWGGAARGAGPPQANFALESAIDMLADKSGMDPLEFRELNSLKPGGTQATGWRFRNGASRRFAKQSVPTMSGPSERRPPAKAD